MHKGDFDYLALSWSGASSDFWSLAQVQFVCSTVAKTMLTGNAFWGLGVFRSYGCYLDGKLVDGVTGTSPWLMTLEPGANAFTVGLYRQATGEVARSTKSQNPGPRLEVQYELRLTPANYIAEFLRDENNARLLTAPFVLSLPAVARVSIKDIARGYKELQTESFNERVAAIAPPNRVSLNSLASVDPMKNARLADVGRGVLTAEGNRNWRWALYDASQRFPSNEVFLSTVSSADVQAQLAESITRIYSAAFDSEDPFFLASALKGKLDMSTYTVSDHVAPLAIGVRYGRDIDGSEADFGRPITTLGVVVEARAGMMKGFRGYYDQMPTVTNPETQAQFGARRALVGRTFDFKLPVLADRLELTPRVGVWDVKTKVLLVDPAQPDFTDVLPIEINRALGVGLEGGLEFSAANFVGRLWGSKDFSAGGKLDRYSGGSVQGTRYGADGIFRLMEIGGKRTGNWLAPMVFVLKEHDVITSTQAQSIQMGDQLIQFDGATVDFAMTFVGGGLGVIF